MKVLERLSKISPDPLEKMIKGCDGSRIILTALDLDLFDLLEDSKTAEEISTGIGTEISLTEKFLNALVAVQILVKLDGRYVNTELASTYLIKSSPFYQGHILRLSANSSNGWLKLHSKLVGDMGDVPERNDEDLKKVFDPDFILAMAEGSMRGSLHRTVNEVSALPEFTGARKLLDLGGGHGLYAIAFAQMNHDLEATVFDLPHVTEVTKKFIKRYEMSERVSVTGGDFLESEIGSEYDIIFASDVLYSKPDILASVLKKLYGALNNSGSVMLKHWVLNEDRIAPPTSVFFDLMLSLRGDWHHIYTENEYIRLLQDTGFSNIRAQDISSATSPSVIIIGNKEA